MRKLRNLIQNRKQRGFIVSAELIFIVTILVIGLLVGWVAVRNAVVAELHDVAEAVGSVDQGFTFSGTNGGTGVVAGTEGSDFGDESDGAAFNPDGAIAAGDGFGVIVTAPLGDTEDIQNF